MTQGQTPDDPDDDTIRVARTVSEDDTAVAVRHKAGPDPQDGRAELLASDTGSTVVVRRESRRRAARATSAPGDRAPIDAAAVPGSGSRVARAPEPSATSYAPRAAEPLRVDRASPPQRESSAAVSVDDSRRRAPWGRILVICGVAASVVAAVVALALLV